MEFAIVNLMTRKVLFISRSAWIIERLFENYAPKTHFRIVSIRANL